MRADIIKIGNSKGLRIPKVILKQCGMKNTVNLRVENHKLIVIPYEEPRSGWEKDFQYMNKNNDDKLLDQGSISRPWDEKEWQW